MRDGYPWTARTHDGTAQTHDGTAQPYDGTVQPHDGTAQPHYWTTHRAPGGSVFALGAWVIRAQNQPECPHDRALLRGRTNGRMRGTQRRARLSQRPSLNALS